MMYSWYEQSRVSGGTSMSTEAEADVRYGRLKYSPNKSK